MTPRLRNVGETVRGFGRLTLGLSPWAPSQGPDRPAGLTNEFLTWAIARSHPGAAVERFTSEEATSGTTDRHRIRLRWNAAGRDAGLPETMFLKSTARVGKNRALSSVLRMTNTELDFYRCVRNEVPSVAPEAYGMVYGTGGRFLLLLEDLGAGGGLTYSLADEAELRHFELLVDSLAHLHATYWESPRFGTDLGWVKPQRQRPGYGLLTTLFKACRRKILRSDRSIPQPVRRLTELLTREAGTLARLFEQGPRTLAHGDTHTGNSFARADGTAGFLDWQVVHQVCGVRDVAYMLGTSLSTELRRKHERWLIERYVSRLAERGIHDLDYTTAWELYRVFAVDAWDAVVTTAAFAGLQEPENVERAFARGLATVADLESVQAIEQALRRGRLF